MTRAKTIYIFSTISHSKAFAFAHRKVNILQYMLLFCFEGAKVCKIKNQIALLITKGTYTHHAGLMPHVQKKNLSIDKINFLVSSRLYKRKLEDDKIEK